MQIIKPPTAIYPMKGRSVFLAGSIEMNLAVDWQAKLCEDLKDTDLTIYNPRRDDWDNTWEQKIDNLQFNAQVTWELSALERCELIAMYFAPDTKSPISLLELGLFATSSRMIVCCPEGFWRKGNVDMVCQRYSVRQVATLDLLSYAIKNWK